MMAFLALSYGVAPSYGKSPWDIDTDTKTEESNKIELDNSVSQEVDKATATVKINEEDAKDSKTKAEEKKEKDEEKEEKKDEENTGLATLPNGPAYVGARPCLRIRDGVWGNIVGRVPDNGQVTITGRDGDWYTIESSYGTGYCHASYVFSSPNQHYSGAAPTNPNGGDGGTSNGIDAPNVVIDVDADSIQGKVVQAAKQIHDKYQGSGAFPYHSATEGGNKGCAQVATSALVAAGVLPQRGSVGGLGYASLACVETVSLLEQAGWQAVNVPPYQAGDVVFWETYRPGPSHVGICVESGGNNVQVMNNSSTKKMPYYSAANSRKVVKVMRKL